ncbi:TPA: hypothetical protein ACYEOW_003742 [Raoultella terrigena]|uniref:hypothetical protein n=1 Tax=Raoultella terrigena TaxID=577 RepID=UPI001D1052B3
MKLLSSKNNTSKIIEEQRLCLPACPRFHEPQLPPAAWLNMGIPGATGSYACLTRDQRTRIATLAKQHAGIVVW